MSRASKAIRGTLWSSGATYLMLLVSFTGNLILARLLFPEDFGTYALASSTLTLIFVISGFGSQEAIIQCRDKDLQHLIPTAFWITLGLGLVLGAAGSVMGLVIMNWGQNPIVGFLVIILSWVKFVRMISFAYGATITRQVRYRPMAYLVVMPTLISFPVAVIMAWLGFGIWSLLARDVVAVLVRYVLARQMSSFRLTRDFDRVAAGWIWSFGWRSMFSRLGEVIFGKWDNLVVGTVMGTAVLGNYTMAYRLALTGSQLTQQPVDAISHATYASIQSESNKLRLALEKAAYWLFRSSVLLALMVWFAGAQIALLLYGQKWALAAETFRHMFFFVALLPLITNFKFFLIGSGNINRQLSAQVVQIVSFFPLLFLAAYRGSLVQVAWALNISSLVTVLLMIYFIQQIIAVKWRYIMLKPLLAGGLSALVAFGANQYLVQWDGPGWLSTLVLVAITGGVYLLLTILFDGRALRDELALIRAHLA